MLRSKEHKIGYQHKENIYQVNIMDICNPMDGADILLFIPDGACIKQTECPDHSHRGAGHDAVIQKAAAPKAGYPDTGFAAHSPQNGTCAALHGARYTVYVGFAVRA
jgi:hypothetical protein